MSADRPGGPQPPIGDPLTWWRETTAGAPQPQRGISLELRWFGVGDPPGDLRALTAGAPSHQRSDRYAELGRDDISLKLRGRMRVSIKQRRCRVPVVDGLPPAERWSRRSARVDHAEAQAGLRWVTLTKHRARTLVDLTGPTPSVATGPRGLLLRGGAIELVDLRLPEAGVRLWSAACETWGPGDRDGLARLTEWSAVDWAGVDRSSLMAAGYPALLRRFHPPTRTG